MHWNWGLILAAALVVTVPAGAQQKQRQPAQKQQAAKQAKTKPNKKSTTPFDPCTGSGLTPPGQNTLSPDAKSPQGKSKPAVNSGNGQQGLSPGLPASPGATKAGRKNVEKKKNPFPLAKSRAAQAKAGKQQAAPENAAEANPFPEAKSEAAQNKMNSQQGPSQTGAYSSSDQRMRGTNVLGNGPMVQGPLGPHPAYDPKLAAKDDKVGKFYLQTGDWAGAYGRYKQAAKVNPGDIKAVIGLAISADHLGKRQVAIRNYKLYLHVLPNGKYSKRALKALKRLSKQH